MPEIRLALPNGVTEPTEAGWPEGVWTRDLFGGYIFNDVAFAPRDTDPPCWSCGVSDSRPMRLVARGETLAAVHVGGCEADRSTTASPACYQCGSATRTVYVGWRHRRFFCERCIGTLGEAPPVAFECEPAGEIHPVVPTPNTCRQCGEPMQGCGACSPGPDVCPACFHRFVGFNNLDYDPSPDTETPWRTDYPVGLEIECEGGNRTRLLRAPFEESGTGVGGDGSLGEDGLEARLPPLNGGKLASTIEAVTTALRDADFQPTVDAGVHAHVWADPLMDAEVAQLLRYTAAFEDVIYAMMPPSRNGNQYCLPITEADRRAERAAQVDSLTLAAAYKAAFESETRYLQVNTQPFWHGRQTHSSGRRTIEYRVHSATLDPEKLVNWANIVRAITMNAGQYNCDPDAWRDLPLSPEKVEAFLKGIEREDTFEYVMKRIIKFEDAHGLNACAHLPIKFNIKKMEGSGLWVAGKELPLEPGEDGELPPDDDEENYCYHNGHDWHRGECNRCGYYNPEEAADIFCEDGHDFVGGSCYLCGAEEDDYLR